MLSYSNHIIEGLSLSPRNMRTTAAILCARTAKQADFDYATEAQAKRCIQRDRSGAPTACNSELQTHGPTMIPCTFAFGRNCERALFPGNAFSAPHPLSCSVTSPFPTPKAPSTSDARPQSMHNRASNVEPPPFKSARASPLFLSPEYAHTLAPAPAPHVL